MAIFFTHKGDLKETERFLQNLKKKNFYRNVEKFAQEGVEALSAATPLDSGETSESWGYLIEDKGDTFTITWTNSNVNEGVNIAIILQYGHGTGTGGYVAGQDYINPALKPIFDKIADDVWKEVTSR